MALSGSFQKSIRSGKQVIKCSWSGSQDKGENITCITAKLYLINNESISIGQRDCSITINGSTRSFKSPTITTTGTHLLGTVSVDVPHNADGTKEVSMSFIMKMNNGFPDGYVGSISASKVATLDVIDRATTFTISATSIEMGRSVLIRLNPAVDARFTHQIIYKFGTASGAIASGLKTQQSAEWIPSIDLASEIPNAASGTATITCVTYDSNGLNVGMTKKTITLTVPTIITPHIRNIYVVDAMGYESKYGGYVQNKSKATINVTANGNYGSTVVSFRIQANGSAYTGANNYCTTSELKTSGNNKITVTVTDTRGRSFTGYYTLNVIPYVAPAINRLTVLRCNADGTENAEGEYMKIEATATISSINNNNSKSFKLMYKEESAASYTTYETYTGAYTYHNEVILAADIDKKHNILLTATDDFSTSNATKTLDTVYVLMDFNASGKGVAFGKVSQKDAFELNMIAMLFERIIFNNTKGINFYKSDGTTEIGGIWANATNVNVSTNDDGMNVYIGNPNKPTVIRGKNPVINDIYLSNLIVQASHTDTTSTTVNANSGTSVLTCDVSASIPNGYKLVAGWGCSSGSNSLYYYYSRAVGNTIQYQLRNVSSSAITVKSKIFTLLCIKDFSK